MKQTAYQFQNTRYNFETAQKGWQAILPDLPPIKTVLDLGCGMGAWSAALEEKRDVNLQLVDHPKVPTEDLLVSNKASFTGIDLDKDLPDARQWDLIICIEVLEHFNEKRALALKDFIVESTDLVLFSAAVPGQGGIGHINCQRHSYWHAHFQAAGFTFYDGFKRHIIHNQTIPFWIRQNLFVYYRPKYASYFKDKINYTPRDFELIQAGMLRNEIGLKRWLMLGPTIISTYVKRKFKKFWDRA